MDTIDWSFQAGYCKIKTARQQKRLQKEDYNKRLIQLDRLRDKLCIERRNLPLVPLETPYQKGWKRSFVLREDVARSRNAMFYQELLEKINTVVYHHDKRFKYSKKKRRKKIQVDIPQTLREFCEPGWKANRIRLTDAEKALFYPKEVRDKNNRPGGIRYVFAEPWRYVLQVRPHMITHVKMIDEMLEQEIQRLDNYIETHNLRHKINKLMDGFQYSPVRELTYRQHQQQKLFKQPTYKILACVED
jgi:hypothetical protein